MTTEHGPERTRIRTRRKDSIALFAEKTFDCRVVPYKSYLSGTVFLIFII